MAEINLIGIHGPLNGGKDTVADYLTLRDVSLEKYEFARPIKKACQVLFGFTHAQLNDRKLKEAVDPFWGFPPRKVMQLLGTEFARNMLRDDVWIKRAELEHLKNLKSGKRTIISDVRFQNEADWVRAQPNSLLIYLVVPELERDEKYLHASEAGITSVPGDILITNDKKQGLNELYSQLDRLFSKP